ncbi:MAG: hypothetical protein AAFO69_10140, partial [Bacteroidota bacterium]
DIPKVLQKSDGKGSAYLQRKYQKHQQSLITERQAEIVKSAFQTVFRNNIVMLVQLHDGTLKYNGRMLLLSCYIRFY